ncbi:DUF537-domain-containing protein [Artemisia annua]|uniref:DUF537-domain-containing protein n=1 Tax=Artemisia annua TaxID=35608 RepID=A0A2U1LRS9_ARTAN|nr:DUF537-domain-containing protein [Artemisia annua]
MALQIPQTTATLTIMQRKTVHPTYTKIKLYREKCLFHSNLDCQKVSFRSFTPEWLIDDELGNTFNASDNTSTISDYSDNDLGPNDFMVVEVFEERGNENLGDTYFDLYPTEKEITYHSNIIDDPRPPFVKIDPRVKRGDPWNIKIPFYIDLESPVNVMSSVVFNDIMSTRLERRKEPKFPGKEHRMMRIYYRKSSSCAIIWDYENVKVPNNLHLTYYQAGENMQHSITKNLKNVVVDSFVVCGNSRATSTNQEQLSGVYGAGAHLADVPSGETDAADRQLIIEMVKFGRQHPPPAFIFLLTGDEDMFQVLKRFFDSGYTTVLVVPKAYSSALVKVAHYTIQCASLFADQLHMHDQIQLQSLPLQKSIQKSAHTVVYWDSNTSYIPTNEHQQALEQIRSRLLEVVGPGGALPSYQVTGVRYIESRNAKSYSLPNTLFTDLVKSAITNSEPDNVVLISGASLFSRALKFLKTLKVRVFTIIPDRIDRESYTILRNSGSWLCSWPPAFKSSDRWNRNKRGREESQAIYRNVKRKLNY